MKNEIKLHVRTSRRVPLPTPLSVIGAELDFLCTTQRAMCLRIAQAPPRALRVFPFSENNTGQTKNTTTTTTTTKKLFFGDPLKKTRWLRQTMQAAGKGTVAHPSPGAYF